MRLLLYLSFISFVSLGLTGCIQVSTESRFQSNGSFVSESDFDFSALLSMTEGLSELGEGVVNEEEMDTEMNKNGLDEFCETTESTQKESQYYTITDFKCKELEKGKFHIRIEGKAESKYFSVKNGIYTLKLNNDILDIDLGNSMEDSSGDKDKSSKESLILLQSMGMNVVQTYIFPVPVTHTDIGKIDGNKVIIDLNDIVKISQKVGFEKGYEFKIVAGERKINSIRHQRTKRNTQLQKYHRRYLLPSYRRNSVSSKVKKIKTSSRRFSARNRRFSQFQRKQNVRKTKYPTQSRKTKIYYHPFANKNGHHYRWTRY